MRVLYVCVSPAQQIGSSIPRGCRGEGEGGMNGEISVDMCTLACESIMTERPW